MAPYCQPSYNFGGQYGDYIASVAIPTTTLSNTTTAAAAPYYTLYPASGSTTATLTAGNTYTIILGSGTYSGNNNLGAWIDYDQNNQFTNGTEKLGETGYIAGSTTGSIQFTVPAWAKNGTTYLRVREVFSNSNIDACTGYLYGETEDYIITITGGVTAVANTYTW